jgi:16S rRNA (guanine527-N7)-methyltransferase
LDDEHLPILRAGAAALGIPLDAAQLQQFEQLRALLIDWNTRINLTAITDPVEIEARHFLDSLTCTLALPPPQWAAPLRVLDIGSGAGFPALPLAIAFPHWRITSLDATAKKIHFQQEVVTALGLNNVLPVHGRAEDLVRQPGERGHYQLVVARAVAALPTLLEYACPFTYTSCRIVLPKKGELAEEIAAGKHAAELLGALLGDPIPVSIPPLDDGRVLVVADQMRRCPPKYPRPGGAPAKHPLGMQTR